MLHHRPTAYAQAPAVGGPPTVINFSAYDYANREAPMSLSPATSAGSTLIFSTTNGQSSGRITSVSDNIDGTSGWVQDVADYPSGVLEIFSKRNCPAGIDTITTTFSGSASGELHSVYEVTDAVYLAHEYWFNNGYTGTVHHSELGVTNVAGLYFAQLSGSGAHNGFAAISGDWTTRPEVATEFNRWGLQDATLDPGPTADRFTCTVTSARTYNGMWWAYVTP